MKVFIAILALIACISAEEWTAKNAEQSKELRTECLKEHPLTPEQMTKVRNFEFPNEEPVRQYFLCSSVKMGIFSSQQGLHADRIAKQFKLDMEEEEVQKLFKLDMEEEEIKKLTEDCIVKHPKGDKPNDVAAYEAHACIMSTKIGERVKNYVKKRHEAAAQKQE